MSLQPEEELKLLESIVFLDTADPATITKIFNTYRTLMNPTANLCAKCPASLRQAFNGLKQYYATHKERLKKQIEDENNKKNN